VPVPFFDITPDEVALFDLFPTIQPVSAGGKHHRISGNCQSAGPSRLMA
jgi:hypothetical protein